MIEQNEQIDVLEQSAESVEKGAATNLKVSVVVAIQNQQDELQAIYTELRSMLTEYGQSYEIIFVDDGSTDGSWKELMTISEQNQGVKSVKMRSAFGEASALDAGVKLAHGENILYFTCRVRINPKDLTRLLAKLDEGYDVVLGVRYPRRDSRLNQFVSRIFNGITNYFTKLNLNDINSGVLAARREVLELVPFYGTLNAFIPVMAHRQGYKIAEVKVEQRPGRFNQSLYLKDYIRRFLDLISVLFLSKYSKKPLHFLGFAGAVFTIIGAVINLYLFFYRILGIGGIAGKPMLLLGTMLFIIGIQMISIGLLGEIIIFTHASSIREYNIEEIIE